MHNTLHSLMEYLSFLKIPLSAIVFESNNVLRPFVDEQKGNQLMYLIGA